jgi:hypothetical protein
MVTGTNVDSIVIAYANSRTGQRGIDAYMWLVSVLRAHSTSTSTTLSHGSSSAVVTVVDGAAVLHCLSGDPVDSAAIIEWARESFGSTATLRGLALPGDRETKNLFEEASLPAQVLLH